MEYRGADDIEWTPAPSQHFTGEVQFGPIRSDSERINVLGVRFAASARTNWHRHSKGQVLYVVSGAGRVGNGTGEVVEMSPGDAVYTPPGELHWHGAGPHGPMIHLSITNGDDTQWEPRPVTDDEYDAPVPR